MGFYGMEKKKTRRIRPMYMFVPLIALCQMVMYLITGVKVSVSEGSHYCFVRFHPIMNIYFGIPFLYSWWILVEGIRSVIIYVWQSQATPTKNCSFAFCYICYFHLHQLL